MSDTEYPEFVNLNYTMTVNGMEIPEFSSITLPGLEITASSHPHTNKEGKDHISFHPGEVSYGEIQLERAMTADMVMYNWAKAIADGQIKENRKDGSISLMDDASTEVAHWDFFQAWPKSISYGQLTSSGGGIITESVTLVIERIERTM